MTARQKFLVLACMTLLMILATGCGSSDLGITTKFFAERYNAEIDKLAKEQGKNLDNLKIVGSKTSSETSGYFEFVDSVYKIEWHKESANAKNINRVVFYTNIYTQVPFGKDSPFLKAVTAAVTAGNKGNAQKISEALNNAFYWQWSYSEAKGIVTATETSEAKNTKFFIVSEDFAKQDRQILAIKVEGVKINERMSKTEENQRTREAWRKEALAERERLRKEANTLQLQERSAFDNLISDKDLGFTPQEFLETFNQTVDDESNLDGKDYSAFKATAPVNNNESLKFNAGNFRINCVKDPGSGKICEVFTVMNVRQQSQNVSDFVIVTKLLSVAAVKKTQANYWVGINLIVSTANNFSGGNVYETAVHNGVVFVFQSQGTEIRWAIFNENYYDNRNNR